MQNIRFYRAGQKDGRTRLFIRVLDILGRATDDYIQLRLDVCIMPRTNERHVMGSCTIGPTTSFGLIWTVLTFRHRARVMIKRGKTYYDDVPK